LYITQVLAAFPSHPVAPPWQKLTALHPLPFEKQESRQACADAATPELSPTSCAVILKEERPPGDTPMAATGRGAETRSRAAEMARAAQRRLLLVLGAMMIFLSFLEKSRLEESKEEEEKKKKKKKKKKEEEVVVVGGGGRRRRKVRKGSSGVVIKTRIGLT